VISPAKHQSSVERHTKIDRFQSFGLHLKKAPVGASDQQPIFRKPLLAWALARERKGKLFVLK
jgi:hypothetical protein